MRVRVDSVWVLVISARLFIIDLISTISSEVGLIDSGKDGCVDGGAWLVGRELSGRTHTLDIWWSKAIGLGVNGVCSRTLRGGRVSGVGCSDPTDIGLLGSNPDGALVIGVRVTGGDSASTGVGDRDSDL